MFPVCLICPAHPGVLQLFRVNVLLQSPDSLDLSTKPPFFVLRRYSQFRQLHAEVWSAHTIASCGLSNSPQCYPISHTPCLWLCCTRSIRSSCKPTLSLQRAAQQLLRCCTDSTAKLHTCAAKDKDSSGAVVLLSAAVLPMVLVAVCAAQGSVP